MVDSRQGSRRISALENFSDRAVFTADRPSRLRFLGPRQLSSGSLGLPGSPTVITALSPLYINNSPRAYLAVNINMDALSASVFKNVGIAGGFVLYAYNTENTVIIHSGDKNKLYSAVENAAPPEEETDPFSIFHRKKHLTASYTSSYLTNFFTIKYAPDNA